ncbi:hypothetical protein B0J13DRAFT_584454 [Dactylonectria estremocensis]|uniref:Uncharacterized protein n=1 Tax=Dactylonectria estremocensis TaxID=1079267 RepID=A0A9P9EYV5_9HYPO|nr:hypothetical protein B0J13DRAFT_584454 [Dactylonectria estremocensis]
MHSPLLTRQREDNHANTTNANSYSIKHNRLERDSRWKNPSTTQQPSPWYPSSLSAFENEAPSHAITLEERDGNAITTDNKPPSYPTTLKEGDINTMMTENEAPSYPTTLEEGDANTTMTENEAPSYPTTLKRGDANTIIIENETLSYPTTLEEGDGKTMITENRAPSYSTTLEEGDDNTAMTEDDAPSYPIAPEDGDGSTMDTIALPPAAVEEEAALLEGFSHIRLDNPSVPIGYAHAHAQSPSEANVLESPPRHSPPRPSLPIPTPPHPGLHDFLQAIHSQETTGGAHFRTTQGTVYDQILRTFFHLTCSCPRTQERQEPEPSNTCSLQETVEHMQHHLPDLSTVFDEKPTDLPRTFFPQWQRFLSDRPVWLGTKDLAAIHAPNDFELTFLPSQVQNLSTSQGIQPHGLDLTHTRHILLGPFRTSKEGSATANGLSRERQQDLYDKIILPAVHDTVSDPVWQEIPRTYDLIYAKSYSFQERPGTDRWKADDRTRAFRLSYTIPARDLARFWASIVDKCGTVQCQTRRGQLVRYFENPQLLFQAHDLKISLTRPTLDDTLALFQDAVLAGLDAGQIDMHSCWLDIGTRDHVSNCSPPLPEPWTLLWKSQCTRQLHEHLMRVNPSAALEASYFRSFLLRDVGTYYAKARARRSSNLGYPHTRELGVARAKAYNCNKEHFGVMLSSYSLFGSGTHPLLAFDEDMIQELSSIRQGRHRAPVAWKANKRHLKALHDPQTNANYGIRREATFRLDVILAMYGQGIFNPDRSPHTGPLTQLVPLHPPERGEEEHYPFWIIPTKEIHVFIFTQAARLILPLDYLFLKASGASKANERNAAGPVRSHTAASAASAAFVASAASSSDPATYSSICQILAFYTAQLLCRMLIYTFTSQRDMDYDHWIWQSRWTVKTRPRGSKAANRDGSGRSCLYKERRGLGIGASIDASGMFWISATHMSWPHGHLALESLIDVYIPRSPLQAPVVHQINVQALTASQVTVDFLFQQQVQDAKLALDGGHEEEAVALANHAVTLAAEEVARAYHQHFLEKMALYWDKVRDKFGRINVQRLDRLRQAREETDTETGHTPTAQMIWKVYIEAWEKYIRAQPAESVENSVEGEQSPQAPTDLPGKLPCWMATRRHLPPKNSWYGEIGRYILIAFNCDQTKEVGTNHTQGTWYHGKPTFFQIQYWAPYFSPPTANDKIPLSSVYRGSSYPEGLTASTTPQTFSAREFQAYERKAHNTWLQIMILNSSLHSEDDETIHRYCDRARRRVTILFGPLWGNLEEGSGHIIPWDLRMVNTGEFDDDGDPLCVPVEKGRIPEESLESTVSRPTILLPTRHNIIGLLDAIETFPALSPRLVQAFNWYPLRSHLQQKKTIISPMLYDLSLLQQFLSQKEPLQLNIEVEGLDREDIEGEEEEVEEEIEGEAEEEAELEDEVGEEDK